MSNVGCHTEYDYNFNGIGEKHSCLKSVIEQLKQQSVSV